LETDEAERDPVAPEPAARALAFTKTPSAVTSPPKRETDRTEELPFPVAVAPPAVERAATDVHPATTAPSPYVQPSSVELPRGGAETDEEEATVPSGSTTRTPMALADDAGARWADADAPRARTARAAIATWTRR
jgi:hypothetical protein